MQEIIRVVLVAGADQSETQNSNLNVEGWGDFWWPSMVNCFVIRYFQIHTTDKTKISIQMSGKNFPVTFNFYALGEFARFVHAQNFRLKPHYMTERHF